MMNLIKKHQSIDWAVLASDPTMPGETQKYVREILSRL